MLSKLKKVNFVLGDVCFGEGVSELCICVSVLLRFARRLRLRIRRGRKRDSIGTDCNQDWSGESQPAATCPQRLLRSDNAVSKAKL